jgi:hypothetical protein
LSEGKTREDMEDDLIIVDEPYISEDTITRARTSAEIKVKSNCNPPPRGQADLTPPKVIVGVSAYFKRNRVSTPVDNNVPTLTVEAFMVAFPLPLVLTLSAEVVVVGSFTWVILRESE